MAIRQLANFSSFIIRMRLQKLIKRVDRGDYINARRIIEGSIQNMHVAFDVDKVWVNEIIEKLELASMMLMMECGGAASTTLHGIFDTLKKNKWYKDASRWNMVVQKRLNTCKNMGALDTLPDGVLWEISKKLA